MFQTSSNCSPRLLNIKRRWKPLTIQKAVSYKGPALFFVTLGIASQIVDREPLRQRDVGYRELLGGFAVSTTLLP